MNREERNRYKRSRDVRWAAKLRKFTWRISMVNETSEDNSDKTLFIFHGAWHGLLRKIFEPMRGTMLQDYRIQQVRLPDMINGKCCEQTEVEVSNPNFQLLSPNEWCRLIGSIMTRSIRCEVTVCKDYEQFLNL